MKRNIIAAACLLTVTSIAPAKSQVMLDLSLVTCKQLLDSDPERTGADRLVDERLFQCVENLNVLDLIR
jgi:acid stress chaperone HdeB